jgi:hypothetical protein
MDRRCPSPAEGWMIYPNDRALIRLTGMLLLEQNDAWRR